MLFPRAFSRMYLRIIRHSVKLKTVRQHQLSQLLMRLVIWLPTGDVAAAVTAGTFSSALDHFAAFFGQNESELGNGVTAVINPGTTSQFTTNTDNFTGTANADTFNGVNGSTNTFSVIDIVNGGAGTDTLNVVLDDNASVFPAATISNIENIVVRELANGTSIDTTAFGGETALVSDRLQALLHLPAFQMVLL